MTDLTDTTRTFHARKLTALTLAAVFVVAAAACSSTSDPAGSAGPVPTSSAPAPLPTQDWNRLACEALPTGMLELLDNLADTRRAAELAAKSSDALMHRHGEKLLTAVTAREQADWDGDKGGAVDANLEISEAANDMAEACSTLYGDGNW